MLKELDGLPSDMHAIVGALKNFTIDDSISKNMWGKEEVMLKLRPYDLSAGKLGSYSGGTIPDELENSLNYFAIRCNKSGTEN